MSAPHKVRPDSQRNYSKLFNAVTETSKFSYLFEPRVNHDRQREVESFEGIKHITTTRNILDHIHQIQSLKPTSMDLTK